MALVLAINPAPGPAGKQGLCEPAVRPVVPAPRAKGGVDVSVSGLRTGLHPAPLADERRHDDDVTIPLRHALADLP